MSGVDIDLPLDPVELRDRFSRATAVTIALITLIAAGVGYLHASAVRLADEAEVEAQQLGISAFGSMLSSEARAQVELQVYSVLAQQRTQSSSLRQEAEGTEGAHAEIIAAQADMWSAMADRTAGRSEIGQNAQFGPDRDLAFPRRYLTEQSLEAFRLSAQQDGVIEFAASWGSRAASFTAVLAILAVSVYLLGLSLTVEAWPAKRSFAATGGLLALAGVGWAAWTALTPLQRPPEEAANSYAVGRVALLTALTPSDYEAAEERFTEAITARPTFAQAYVGRADARFLAGTQQTSGYITNVSADALRGANEDLRRAVEMGLRSRDNLLSLGFFTFLVGLDADDERMYEESIRLTSEAILLGSATESTPTDAVLYSNLGVAFLASGQTDRAEAALDEALRRAIFEDLEGREVRDMRDVTRVASGTLADLELVLDHRPDLAEAISSLKARVVGAVAHQRLDVPSTAASVTAQDDVDVVFPGELQFGVDYQGFGGTDYLSVYWYHQPRDGDSWNVLPEVSGPLWYLDVDGEVELRSDADGAGSYLFLAPVIERTWPPRCIGGGTYRAELYVNGDLSTTVEARADWGELRPLIFRDLGVALCVPSDWQRDPRSVPAYREGFASEDGSRGVFAFRVHNPSGSMADLLDAQVSDLALPGETSFTDESDGYFLGLDDNVHRDYSYSGGIVRAALARSASEGVALGIAVFGPDDYWTESPACEKDDRDSGEACGPLNVWDSARLYDAVPSEEGEEPPDTTDVSVTGVEFALGVQDDAPLDPVIAAPSGASRLCAFWDYEGMPDGASWDALWLVDGAERSDLSIDDEVWAGGPEGSWWVCIGGDTGQLDEGLYELVIKVEEEVFGSNSVFVGGDHPSVSFEIDNGTAGVICYVYASPSLAQNWGPDDLGADVTIEPGARHTLQLPAGTYDILMQDCSSETVSEADDLTIDTDQTYSVDAGG